jgi:hypothetical protein
VTAPVQNRKLTTALLDIGGLQFEGQVDDYKITNGTDNGTVFYTYGGSFAEAAEDSYSLDMTFYADWQINGINDFMWEHDGETVAFQLDHHPNSPTWAVRFNGEVQIKATSVGGTVRETEKTDVSLVCVGKPVKTRP